MNLAVPPQAAAIAVQSDTEPNSTLIIQFNCAVDASLLTDFHVTDTGSSVLEPPVQLNATSITIVMDGQVNGGAQCTVQEGSVGAFGPNILCAQSTLYVVD